MHHIPRTFLRLVNIQLRCWEHGHRKWAKDIGQRIKTMRQDNPTLARY
jgi:hypothetical protein